MTDGLKPVQWCDAKTARKVATLGFPEGGIRQCETCKKAHRATLEQIIQWCQTGRPRCKVCGSKTDLLTPEEYNERLEHEKSKQSE